MRVYFPCLGGSISLQGRPQVWGRLPALKVLKYGHLITPPTLHGVGNQRFSSTFLILPNQFYYTYFYNQCII